MNLNYCAALSLAATLVLRGYASNPILPGSRSALWAGNVGIPGGIPHYPVGVNVKAAPFNAVGDGVADDTAACQAAINACSNFCAVYFPTGIYRITNTLCVPAGYPVQIPVDRAARGRAGPDGDRTGQPGLHQCDQDQPRDPGRVPYTNN